MEKKIPAASALVLAAALLLNALVKPAEVTRLRIATTTSLDDTGILDALKARFEVENPNIDVTWVAVGTGQAIEVAKRGDVDLVIVHDRAAEDLFIDQGYGVHGVTVAWNDFVIVGPPDDPAGVAKAKDAVEAFESIFQKGSLGMALFASRGDRSGTNLRELEIWGKANLSATGEGWYVETGQGMVSTLRLANEKGAYALADRATYLTVCEESGFELEILFEGDASNLLNLYRAIIVDPGKFGRLNYEEAEKFVLFLVSKEGQELIGDYSKKGRKLFNPAFGVLKQLGIDDPYEEEEVGYWRSKLEG
ncbi:MAG: substrate-binding domain-containing protein [Candidatus Brockarchaeota archaeon]|nr:substrate-binding domain-containing protein [Candidatus Brockarchaeota archaeon]